MESNTLEENQPNPEPRVRKSSVLTQMELSLTANWSMKEDRKVGKDQEKKNPAKKMDKKKAMKLIQKTNTKMTNGWLESQ